MATNNNDKKISQLPLADPLSGSELVPVVQNGRNKRVQVSDIASLAGTGTGTGTVNSVNGKPGPDIVLTASDVGAATALQGSKADTAEQLSSKNQPLGYAGLDGSGKVPPSLLPYTVLELQGPWDASTNTPALINGSGTPGQFYIASTSGTVDFGDGPITFSSGDSVICGGDGKYFKSENTNSVLSVNGKSGSVVLNKSDVGLSNVDNTRDLDKPVSTATQTQLSLKANISSLAPSAFSGSYSDLINKPVIPDVSSLLSHIDDLEGAIEIVQNLISSAPSVSLITRETPSGQINGINKIFTLAKTPQPGSEQVYLNGVLQEEGVSGDYTITENTITFNVAPEQSWAVFANYVTTSELYLGGSGSSNISTFQWSSFEQVYPLEKAFDGSTLYCKEIDLGFLTNRGGRVVAHGIVNYSASKIHNIGGTIYNTIGSDAVSLNSLAYGGNFCILDHTNVNVYTPNADMSKYKCKVRLIYSK